MVTVFGLGFVGLTTALGFAHLGYTVYGVDVDEKRKGTLRSGQIPFFEPYMEDVLNEHLDKNFFVTDDIEEAIKNSEYVFYCVGTPYGEMGSADLTYLFSAIDTTVDAIKDEKFRVLVTKSTIPPSTTAEKIYPYVKSKGKIADNIGVANNPEFLREGHCWEDFIEADRIVLGCNDGRSKEMLLDLYRDMNIPIKCVSHSTGEFIKYLSNTLLATLISYSNEMSQVADSIGGIEIAEAFKILHMDKRWNNCDMTSYVYPGCGYGGYCLPKDTSALYSQAKAKGFEPQILKNVISTNDNISKAIVKKITSGLNRDQAIGILGLSFKPESDDVRDTPAAKIIKAMIEAGYKNIYTYDPIAIKEFKEKYPSIIVNYCDSAKEVYDNSEVIAVVTAWEEFKKIKEFGDKKIIDCRYML
ncbi:UDP-glucose dehydrogenase family protein [Clostridium beijerinckii]|uniref:UDP-glucose dehydrogenase family protein n=1 Tax=Clostridium beijerinckii TaxID=1520 RepID=UPI00047E46BE|nr:nucleotide sugar dehydrogenase [Clostridium beijerinckii]